MAVLILIGGCGQPAPAPRTGAAAGPDDEVRWWCVFAADGYSSNCERAVVDCESMRRPPSRRAGPCEAEEAAHCFRYVDKALTHRGTVATACSVLSSHCEERRSRAMESLGQSSVVSECELVK